MNRGNTTYDVGMSIGGAKWRDPDNLSTEAYHR
jgi:hypothetical protein